MKNNPHRWLYLGFVAFGMYKLLKHDFGDASIYLGIALAFDPFDIKQPWKERPKWQKAVLIAQLVVVFGLFFTQIFPEFSQGFKEGFNSK